MAYVVESGLAVRRRVAAIRTTAARSRLGPGIIASLDLIWPELREQGIRTGHNVVIYYGESAGILTMDVGVEVLDDFTGSGEIKQVMTPAGEAAATAHYGEYSDLGAAYAALTQWCTDNARQAAGANWEVYGDWEDDPAERRTDVFMLLQRATT